MKIMQKFVVGMNQEYKSFIIVEDYTQLQLNVN